MLVVCERSMDCASSLAALWDAISDTDRLNWLAGMGPVSFTPVNDASPVRFRGNTVLSGFAVSYDEEPYEWVYKKSFKVRRPMHSGPLSVLEMLFTFIALPQGGTRIGLRTTLIPRYVFLAPVAKIGGWMSLRDLERAVWTIDRELQSGGTQVQTVAKVNESVLEDRVQTLLRLEAAAGVERLVELIRQADDLKAARLRPFAVADAWGLPRRDVLRLFLNATKVGLTALSWELVCPSCRAGARTVTDLSNLQAHQTCQFCDIRFAVSATEAVEAVFCIAPQVRISSLGPFCLGGPGRTPHVYAQAILPARGQAVLPVPDTSGMLRVFVRGGSSCTVKVDSAGPAQLQLRTDTMSNIETPTVQGGGVVTVENAQDVAMHAKLERFDWTNHAATPRDVELMPEFDGASVASLGRPTGS